jgi:membrane-associated phospholipid phosphatase
MNLTLLLILTGSCLLLLLIERLGAPTTLALEFKGDVKRETRWLAQYGQSVCTAVAAIFVIQIQPPATRVRDTIILVAAVLATSIISMVLKRLLGRIRPNRENAGHFTGPSWKHANYRESFPSSHSACAVALTVGLANLYPHLAITFWALALITAGLRYLLDAHWPSDVLGGIALGYAVAWGVWRAFA